MLHWRCRARLLVQRGYPRDHRAIRQPGADGRRAERCHGDEQIRHAWESAAVDRGASSVRHGFAADTKLYWRTSQGTIRESAMPACYCVTDDAADARRRRGDAIWLLFHDRRRGRGRSSNKIHEVSQPIESPSFLTSLLVLQPAGVSSWALLGRRNRNDCKGQ